MSERGPLFAAGILFAAGSAVHIVDHLRRGQDSITETLYVLGNLALVLQVVTITLIVVGHRVAPLAAVAAGFPLAIGFGLAHWVPDWGPISDPVWEIDSLRALSYVASSAEIAGALAIGMVGLGIVRAEGLAAFAP